MGELRVINLEQKKKGEKMARTEKIFKYVLEIMDRQFVNIPTPGIILSVIEQHDQPVLYARTWEDAKEYISYEILIFGTGNPITWDLSDYTFLGTVNTCLGRLIWHIFYKPI
jgi:hypothetical protein